MERVRWDHRPRLERPVMVTAFAGWNDAGDAATSALRFLADEWGAESVATIDPDDFYDFTQVRPTATVDAAGNRVITWPAPELLATDLDAAVPESVDSRGSSSGVFIIGTEPQLRWQAFCDEIVTIARDLDVSRIVHLGALLAEVPHSRPVPLTASGVDGDEPTDRSSRYQGPTGIVGVLHEACVAAGLPTTSLWAAVPTYVSGASSPKAALRLVRRVSTLLDRPVATGLLEISVHAYEGEITQLVADDEDTAAYVVRLEQDYDADDRSADSAGLTDEIEQYLRDHPR